MGENLQFAEVDNIRKHREFFTFLYEKLNDIISHALETPCQYNTGIFIKFLSAIRISTFEKWELNFYSIMEGGKDGKDYEPYDHRTTEKPTNYMGTMMHFLKGSFGTGILAMPQAYHNAGFIPGVIFMLLIGYLATYGLHIILKCQYRLCVKNQTPLIAYPHAMRIAVESTHPKFVKWGKPLQHIVNVFMILFQIGICAAYDIFIAANIKMIVDANYGKSFDVKIYMVIIFIPLLLIMMIRNYKILVPFSTGANVLLVFAYGAILYYVFKNLPHIKNVPYVAPITKFPLFFGTALFALESPAVVIALESNIKNPRQFVSKFGVLNVAMAITTIFYTIMGFLGYWRYLDKIKSSITLNLPRDEVLPQVIAALYCAAIYVSYGLNGLVPVNITWDEYILNYSCLQNKSSKQIIIFNCIVRFLLVLITTLAAIAIPFLGLVISVSGSVCMASLGFTFPGILDIAVNYPNFGKYKYILLRDLLFIAIGVIGAITGISATILELITILRNQR